MAEPLLVGIVSIVIMVAISMIGVPIVVATGLVGICGLIYDIGFTGSLGIIGTLPFAILASFGISLVPLFYLMGDFVAEAGIADDVFDSAHKIFGRFRGGLALATTFGSGLSAATMGSSIANAVLFTRIAFPPMIRYKYDKAFALGCIASVRSFALMIPPSISFVLYGISTNESIGALLIAGIIPGIVTIFAYVALIVIRCRLNPALAPLSDEEFTFKEKLRSSLNLWSVLALFGLVMGGIYTGFFTPSAGGAVGAFGAMVLALAKGRFSLELIKRISIGTMQGTTSVIILLVGGFLFARHLVLCGFTGALIDIIVANSLNPMIVMTLICLMYLVLGCVMDPISMLVTTMPFIHPVVTGMGFSGIWWGVVFIKLTEIAAVTPPLGANLFVVAATAGPGTSVVDVIRGIVPFLLADLVVMAILFGFPEMATFLPSRMY